jgi:hypothetical protein
MQPAWSGIGIKIRINSKETRNKIQVAPGKAESEEKLEKAFLGGDVSSMRITKSMQKDMVASGKDEVTSICPTGNFFCGCRVQDGQTGST